MGFTYTFGNLTQWNAGWLDANFTAAGLLGTLPCSATGTNALVLTPLTTPALSAPNFSLQAQVRVQFIAPATNTGAVTANVGGTGALPVYKDTASGPVALSGNEIIVANLAVLTYDVTLNGGGGGYHLGTAPSTAAGTVTSVGTGTGLTGGTITGSGTISLATVANLRLLANISGITAAPSPNTMSAILDAVFSNVQGTVLYRGASVWAALGPGTSGQFLQTKGAAANPVWAAASSGAAVQAQPANPTGTTSTGGVMMGLAGAITPTLTGRVLIIISGNITNGTASDGGSVTIRYGTGTAPSNAAALTGTAVGTSPQAVAGTVIAPFSVQAIVTSLTLSTAYWIDLSLAAVTGGTATIANVSISALEF